ncbi:MAG: replication-associated recombination protein A [Gemmatimonadaceae bacterium]|jgi:putative ATPase|nr:replication-associated recombination protein A [Gemmatimonadaceae bacterium]
MPRSREPDAASDTLFSATVAEPLAARMRPRTLDEMVGQQHLVGPGRPLRLLAERRELQSLILWGPPGTGKTTLGRLLAQAADATCVFFSAVTDGVARVREVVEGAQRRRGDGGRTVLFVDEIHRFNRAQQDAFLPHVEAGTIALIGATTENPSFELNGALLSRARVVVLEPLTVDDLVSLVGRALADVERGLGARRLRVDADARRLLAEWADGDARRALGALEAIAQFSADGAMLDAATVADQLARRVPQYDKSGEGHFNAISALHKTLRNSDAQGALYWFARMIDAGEAPLYIARRLVRFASEDIGLADPNALTVAIAARDAYDFLGSPEGDLALAEAVLYLATAPKSNRAYVAWKRALAAARETPTAPVPLALRNAPTRLMKELGYGDGYEYAHDAADGVVDQQALPDAVAGQVFYEPGRFGFERDIAKRLAWWAERRAALARPDHPHGTNSPHDQTS